MDTKNDDCPPGRGVVDMTATPTVSAAVSPLLKEKGEYDSLLAKIEASSLAELGATEASSHSFHVMPVSCVDADAVPTASGTTLTGKRNRASGEVAKRAPSEWGECNRTLTRCFYVFRPF